MRRAPSPLLVRKLLRPSTVNGLTGAVGLSLCPYSCGPASLPFCLNQPLTSCQPTSNWQEWCRANGAECLAVQPPGRNMRGKEPPLTRCSDLAAALLPVVASRLLDGCHYVVIAHSVGTWNAYEFLRLVQAQGLPLPLKCFFSGT